MHVVAVAAGKPGSGTVMCAVYLPVHTYPPCSVLARMLHHPLHYISEGIVCLYFLFCHNTYSD